MKYKLNIFSNGKIKNFLKILLYEYELEFTELNDIDTTLQKTQANIIILNNIKDTELPDLKKLNDNYLILSNLRNNIFNFKNNVKLIYSPLSINNIKTKIENFLQNLIIQFHDIAVNNEKLINIKTNSFCYLTKVEFEILRHLIRERETQKNFVKENILNIKSNIDTNSLESHLTRIRKKMHKIKTTVKIQTKNDRILLII